MVRACVWDSERVRQRHRQKQTNRDRMRETEIGGGGGGGVGGGLKGLDRVCHEPLIELHRVQSGAI